MFREVDDIVRLGKWAFGKIPDGERCKGCVLLGNEKRKGYNNEDLDGWYCGLRPVMALMHDNDGPFKDTLCPKRKTV